MKIHKIILHNIRSYQYQEINFPVGTVLLSGEVGSGKSSILLGLDFALFGIQSGVLPGGSLLRNGTMNGYVEIIFEINYALVKVRRTLKRHGNSVVQDSGYIDVNGQRDDLSPIEIKNRVLNLLNYPEELVTKSKNLIYRYTVYTPQEEMKQILLGDQEYRLETLRRVFGIDKYKRIKDNVQIFIGYLKALRRELAGKTSDLQEKISLRKDLEASIAEIGSNINKVDSRIEQFKILLGNKDHDIKVIEENIKEFIDMEKQFGLTLIELNNKKEHKEKNIHEIELTLKKLDDLERETVEVIDVDFGKINEKEGQLKSLQKTLYEINAKAGGLRGAITSSEDIKNTISSLDICPLCKQKVNSQHVEEVISRETRKIKEAQEMLQLFEVELQKNERDMKTLIEGIEALKRHNFLRETYLLKKMIIEEKREFLQRLIIENKNLDKEIGMLHKNKESLQERMGKFKNVRDRFEILRNERKRVHDDYLLVELEKARLETELSGHKKRLSELNNEINSKENTHRELLHWTRIQDWLSDYFVPLVEVIEKKTMLKIHHDFDSLFRHWFQMLIGNELISVRLDEGFTPLIEQNGYFIDYTFLSGGEKTAAALAYRLALNQVINKLVESIATKDLLILDEPTDGFSDMQLDRMRDVFRDLNVDQLLLVSHESKVESFVDHVIKITKKEHVSGVC